MPASPNLYDKCFSAPEIVLLKNMNGAHVYYLAVLNRLIQMEFSQNT